MEKTILERGPQSTNAPKRVAVYCRVAANGTDPINSLEAQRTYYVTFKKSLIIPARS